MDSLIADGTEHRFSVLARDGYKKSSRSLRIGEYMASPIGHLWGHLDLVPIARPIAVRCTGHEALLCQNGSVREKRHIIGVDHKPQLSAARHFEAMTKQAKPGYVSDSMDAFVAGEFPPILLSCVVVAIISL